MQKMYNMRDDEALRDFLGKDVFARLRANRHMCLALADGALLIAFHFCDIRNPSRREDKVCIYCSAEDYVFVGDDKQCREIALQVKDAPDSYTRLIEFFLALTASDVYELEKAEDRITDLEDRLITETRSSADDSTIIVNMRRELLKMKRYYEQLAMITEDLTENTNNAFSKELLKRVASLDKRMDYLLNSVLHLREYITQVREAYQAQVDIEQNQIMKVFTVITSIFLPLTLIVGWYGMNLQMPEFKWSYGYPFAIALSVMVVIVSIMIFKRKKWF